MVVYINQKVAATVVGKGSGEIKVDPTIVGIVDSTAPNGSHLCGYNPLVDAGLLGVGKIDGPGTGMDTSLCVEAHTGNLAQVGKLAGEVDLLGQSITI